MSMGIDPGLLRVGPGAYVQPAPDVAKAVDELRTLAKADPRIRCAC